MARRGGLRCAQILRFAQDDRTEATPLWAKRLCVSAPPREDRGCVSTGVEYQNSGSGLEACWLESIGNQAGGV